MALGTATDYQGRFVLTLPVVKGALEFSFVGCEDSENEFYGEDG